jgi:exodeoxyribonuclease VII small subunit
LFRFVPTKIACKTASIFLSSIFLSKSSPPIWFWLQGLEISQNGRARAVLILPLRISDLFRISNVEFRISSRPPFFSPDWTHLHFCLNLRVVPITPKNAGATPPAKADDLPFEDALKKLEAIVEAMESEDLPLETLLAKYEEGTRLARVCQEKLAEAEVKIQQLEKNAAGELKLKPLTLEESEAD